MKLNFYKLPDCDCFPHSSFIIVCVGVCCVVHHCMSIRGWNPGGGVACCKFVAAVCLLSSNCLSSCHSAYFYSKQQSNSETKELLSIVQSIAITNSLGQHCTICMCSATALRELELTVGKSNGKFIVLSQGRTHYTLQGPEDGPLLVIW